MTTEPDSPGDEPLLRDQMAPHPMDQFHGWWEEAQSCGLVESSAMTLATVSEKGAPSARTVLLRQADRGGFVFYSNYESRKGEDLAANPVASLHFYWDRLHRQVRVEGDVTRLTRKESEAYFSSRPWGSQLSAWVSRQSKEVKDRASLDAEWDSLAKRFPEGSAVPLPPFWGGYRFIPREVEFWQGRSFRLHDRLRYERSEGGGAWKIVRLMP